MAAPHLPRPLVTAEWLAAHLGEPGLAIIDASWYLPSAGRDARAEYRQGHIPGAVFWDLDALSDPESPLPHMLPGPDRLGRGIGGLGISNRDRVVVYDGSGNGQSAARVWWTFRVAGHSAVAVLDGGLGRWRSLGLPLESGQPVPVAHRFTVRPVESLIRTQPELESARQAGAVQILDARSGGRFQGTEPEPRPGLRGGHIPGSASLPFAELVDSEGKFLPPDQLRARFLASGIDLDRPVVTSCGSGVTACVLGLGLELLGHRDWAVYDGSWSEWGRPGGPPVETGPPAVQRNPR